MHFLGEEGRNPAPKTEVPTMFYKEGLEVL